MSSIDWSIQQVRGTAKQMEASNVTLEAGQLGYESDTRKGKVGPGEYNSLPYLNYVDAERADEDYGDDGRNSIALDAKADAANVPTVLDVIVNGTTMTGVNQFDTDFTVTNPESGIFYVIPDSGEPFAGLTFASLTFILPSLIHCSVQPASDLITIRFSDTSGAAVDPPGAWMLFVRTYQ